MLQQILSGLFMVVFLYLFIGVLFTPFFLTQGIKKVDEDVPGSSWGFYMIIIPGCILLWPVLLKKWMDV